MPLAARLIASLLLIGLFCLQPSTPAQADWPRIFGGSGAEPGTPAWWKANKNKAVHEIGKGYSVPGVEGYFDGNGRPIDKPANTVARDFDEQESKGIAPWLDPKPAMNRAKVAMGYGPDEQRARQALAAADTAMREKKFDAAEKLYREAASRAPKTAIEQSAMFGYADSKFFNDDYTDAFSAYEDLLERYPNTPNFDEAIERLWAIGQYWDKHHELDKSWAIKPNMFDDTRPRFDTAGNAIKAYEAIRLNDPTGPRADDALMATAGIYFRRAQFDDADYHYSLVREEYPRSDFQFEAHLLGLQSKLRKYKGADYDGSPLEEAKKLARQIQVQFAGRLSPVERERLDKTRADVERQIAQRELRMAKYYEDTGHNLAAKFHYSRVARRYSRTKMADEAQSKMTSLASAPDVPEERLSWLVEMFPENAERSRVDRVPGLGDAPTMIADERSNAGSAAGTSEGTATR